MSCAARWAVYEPLALSARKCDPNAAMPECKFDVVVLDACGCSIPANATSPDYAKARQLLPSYANDCDFPQQCTSCEATLNAACTDDGTGIPRCVYR